MQKRATVALTGLAALAVLGWGSPGVAQEPAKDSAQVERTAAGPPVQLPAVTVNARLFLGKPVDEGTLAEKRGGAGISDMKLNGVVADNQAVNIGVTGNNVINQGAFTNASGVPMLIQNSGNNVLIQNATIVNVEVK